MKKYNKKLKEILKLNKGFTLLELLVVVLIIGILAAIAIQKYQLVVDKTKYSQAMTLLAALNSAQNRYILANGSFTTDLYKLDIELPPSGTITSNSGINNYYQDKWGNCLLHGNGYGECAVKIGSADVWYFLYWNSSNNRSCWVTPKENARGNRLCKAMTGKTNGTENFIYMVYRF